MIVISILDCDLLNVEETLHQLKADGITHLHLDILDTSFVPNISFGPKFINQVLQFDFIFDVHLMVENPICILRLLDLDRIDTVVVHYESKYKFKAIEYLKQKNIKIGLAINPNTKLEEVISTEKSVFQNITRILIMTVFPGFGNQTMIDECVDKINQLVDKKIEFAVDGGVNLDTIEKVKGFDFIVVGSAYFKEANRKKFVEKLYSKINEK